MTYRNNRMAPALIIAVCIVSIYFFLSPAPNHRLSQPLDLGTSVKIGEASHVQQHEHVSSEQDVPPQEMASPPAEDKEPDSAAHVGSADGSLSPNDVLLIMKTGGTTMWKRLLAHLMTSLAEERIPHNNIVIYSDLNETIGHFRTIDVLANMSHIAGNTPDFDVYRQQPEYMAHNYYVEASGVAGDEWGPTGGWIIDKYKFIPLMQHAGDNWPRAKWYIYMEDDTYLFLPQVLSYLSRFDHRRPHYLGSYAAKSDRVFAHGGAGFAVSRAAWEKSFGVNSNLTNEYYEYTADHCCGDQVLAHALDKYGVRFGENDGDGKFTWGFNPVVHWAFGFSRHNWCSPLMSWHKVHSRDVAAYYELERSFDFSKPLLHKDFFGKMMLHRVQERKEWWDNMSGVYEVTSANKEDPPAPPDAYEASVWKKGWESADACEAACKSWVNCVQWSFVEDLCRLDDKVFEGQGFAPAMSQRKTSLKHTSGWLPDRLNDWSCS
ncbi:glycosyltransferase family 31 protein [Stachybotrys elegans]|uniref:N-acetylgalactosaminide beta-1,3-galactosyltransferase n=1 Tax=Stachybotrys elegans TaxID=80388 RepID=A0A8K0WU42_9HYPO|nr:glycosyltransferase family 31 protein [Stachybotrys elegans]